MFRKKIITIILIACLYPIFCVHEINPLGEKQDIFNQSNLNLTEIISNHNVTVLGVGKISMNASIHSLTLKNGTHPLSVSLEVIEFYGACYSIINITLYFYILNHSLLYFNSATIHDLDEVGINESTELSFNYQEPWGNVNLYLRIKYTSVHSTGDEFIPHDSGWYQFFTLSPLIETQESGNMVYLFVTSIAVIILSLARFSKYRSKKSNY